MGFVDALLAPRAEVTSSDFATGGSWTSVTDSGQAVNTTKAMRVVSVYACVTLIADAIRALPVDVYRKVGDGRVPVARPPQWLRSPNPEQGWGQFIDYALHALLTNGNAPIWIAGKDQFGFAEDLYVLHPDDVTFTRIKSEDGRRLKEVKVNGVGMREFTARHPEGQILHIMAHTADGVVGLSPIEQAKQAIGGALAVEKFGNKFWDQSAMTTGVLELPSGSNPTDEQLTRIGKAWRRKFSGSDKAWMPIVLANGATYKPIQVPNDDAQFIETRKFSVAEIARLYRVPPHLIGDVERSTSWGSGIEEQNIGFVSWTLMPWITRLEEAFSQLLPRGQFIKFNVNSLLRGDTGARANFYQTLGGLKAIEINEIRAFEDMPPLPDGDQPPPAPNESL